MLAEVIVIQSTRGTISTARLRLKTSRWRRLPRLKGGRLRITWQRCKQRLKKEGKPLMADGKNVVVNEQQVDKFLYTTLKLNSTIMYHSRMAAVVLVSLPPPPLNHPAYFYMEYMDLLVENIPRILIVRGYRRDVVTLFT
ncbi:unnamed protein product [Lactuca virosa]|uniref:SLC12A transporter C-terminal domain-containing protein n=1 Tax=Lactuca virosa TaxID=75947 RepID=A0AAU9LN15_9ASTR|nr:unnamed protein product [Lactuca virosa]